MRSSRNGIAKFVLFFLSFIMGIMLSLQLKIMDGASNGQSISDTAAHLQVELTNIRDRKAKTEKEITNLEEKIRLLKDSQAKEDEIYKNLRKEIDQYEVQAGMTKAVGPGVVIDFILTEKEQSDILLANYDLLLSVINKLNASGAEGIAINEERVTYMTDLRYEQGNLLVNNNPVGNNLQIRAIGNPDTLEATLNMKYGILWEMKSNYSIHSKIEKQEEVELPQYTQEMNFKFAEIVVK